MYLITYVINVLHNMYLLVSIIFFFKQKTAYEMRISDWSSDVCSSDLPLKKVLRWWEKPSEVLQRALTDPHRFAKEHPEGREGAPFPQYFISPRLDRKSVV